MEKSLTDREKRAEYDRRWRTKNPEGVKKRDLKRRYGISKDDLDVLVAAQAGKCKICQVETALQVDHSHETKEIRGLLCQKCNKGLGLFKDNPEILRIAAMYLEKN